MATYFVDDGGDNTDGSTWAKAYTSIQSLDTAVSIATDDRIYIGADSNCTNAGAALTITGPASGNPAYLISSTVGAGTTVSYSAGSGDQIIATGGNYDITFDGSFALYGIRVKAGQDIIFASDANEHTYALACEFLPGALDEVACNGAAGGRCEFHDCTINCTQDSGATGNQPFQVTGNIMAFVRDMTFTNATNRTGTVFATTIAAARLVVDGADCSGFTNATDCELVTTNSTIGEVVVSNILTKASPTMSTGAPTTPSGRAVFVNCGSADDPTHLFVQSYFGTQTSTTAIYRSSGADIGGTAVSWLITTTSTCAEGSPFYTEWLYGEVASTGSKTFDLYITNDTADLTDAEAWLEVEYLVTSGEAQWALASDHRTITTTAAAQTDDVSSTWNGSGPSYTYKQKLSVTATIGQAGQYRARVAVGKASIASSAYFYVDPLVTVS